MRTLLAISLVTYISFIGIACEADDGPTLISLRSLSGPASVSQSVSRPLADLSSVTLLDHVSQPLRRRDLPTLGAQSCASASCHGGPHPGISRPTAARGSEYSLWLENDPHAQSWRTMCSDQSVEILQRLRIMQGDEIIDRDGFDNCMACHNTSARYSEPRSPHPILEGVGCSACHGPAGNWIGDHFSFGQVGCDQTHAGMIRSADMLSRARMCASCHVGDSDRDMNHDIIAAGHPALRYEMATYHNRMPKHWRDAGQHEVDRFEATLWLVGQIAAVDASLKLLESRANNSNKVSTWPELSAYDCGTCHHSLRIAGKGAPDVGGLPRYSDWNLIGLEWVIQERIDNGSPSPADRLLLESLQIMRRAMETQSQPDRVLVASVVRTARKALDQWLQGGPGQIVIRQFDAGRLSSLSAHAANSPEAFARWERSAQFYLAAVASRSNWSTFNSNDHRVKAADRLRELLRFEDRENLAEIRLGDSRRERQQAIDIASLAFASQLGTVTREPSITEADRLDLDSLRQSLQREVDRFNREHPKPVVERPLDVEKPREGGLIPIKPPEKGTPGPDQPADPLEDLKRRLENIEKELEGK